MFRHLVRQRLDQLVLPPSDEAAQILTHRRVIDCSREIVTEIGKSSARLQYHRNGDALRLRTLQIGHADTGHQFQRFDSDLVVRRSELEQPLEFTQIAHHHVGICPAEFFPRIETREGHNRHHAGIAGRFNVVHRIADERRFGRGEIVVRQNLPDPARLSATPT